MLAKRCFASSDEIIITRKKRNSQPYLQLGPSTLGLAKASMSDIVALAVVAAITALGRAARKDLNSWPYCRASTTQHHFFGCASV